MDNVCRKSWMFFPWAGKSCCQVRVKKHDIKKTFSCPVNGVKKHFVTLQNAVNFLPDSRQTRKTKGKSQTSEKKSFYITNIYQQLRVRFHRGKANKRVKLLPTFSGSREREKEGVKKRAMSFVVYLIKVKKVLSHFQLWEQ